MAAPVCVLLTHPEWEEGRQAVGGQGGKRGQALGALRILTLQAVPLQLLPAPPRLSFHAALGGIGVGPAGGLLLLLLRRQRRGLAGQRRLVRLLLLPFLRCAVVGDVA